MKCWKLPGTTALGIIPDGPLQTWQDMAGRRVFLSEAQLVIADPFAEVQQWHMDAASGRGQFATTSPLLRCRGA